MDSEKRRPHSAGCTATRCNCLGQEIDPKPLTFGPQGPPKPWQLRLIAEFPKTFRGKPADIPPDLLERIKAHPSQIDQVVDELGLYYLQPEFLKAAAGEQLCLEAQAEAEWMVAHSAEIEFMNVFNDSPNNGKLQAVDNCKTMAEVRKGSKLEEFFKKAVSLMPGYRMHTNKAGKPHLFLLNQNNKPFPKESSVQTTHSDMFCLHGEKFDKDMLRAFSSGKRTPRAIWISFGDSPIGLYFYLGSHHAVLAAYQYFVRHYDHALKTYLLLNPNKKEKEFLLVWHTMVFEHLRQLYFSRQNSKLKPSTVMFSEQFSGGIWNGFALHGGLDSLGLRIFGIAVPDNALQLNVRKNVVDAMETSPITGGLMGHFVLLERFLCISNAAQDVAQRLPHNRSEAQTCKTAVEEVMRSVQRDYNSKFDPDPGCLFHDICSTGSILGLKLKGGVVWLESLSAGRGQPDYVPELQKAYIYRGACFYTEMIRRLQRRGLSCMNPLGTPAPSNPLVSASLGISAMPHPSVPACLSATFGKLAIAYSVIEMDLSLCAQFQIVLKPWYDGRVLSEGFRLSCLALVRAHAAITEVGFLIGVFDPKMWAFNQKTGQACLVFTAGGALGPPKGPPGDEAALIGFQLDDEELRKWWDSIPRLNVFWRLETHKGTTLGNFQELFVQEGATIDIDQVRLADVHQIIVWLLCLMRSSKKEMAKSSLLLLEAVLNCPSVEEMQAKMALFLEDRPLQIQNRRSTAGPTCRQPAALLLLIDMALQVLRKETRARAAAELQNAHFFTSTIHGAEYEARLNGDAGTCQSGIRSKKGQ